MKKPLEALAEMVVAFVFMASVIYTFGATLAWAGWSRWMTLGRAWDLAAWIAAVVWLTEPWREARRETKREARRGK